MNTKDYLRAQIINAIDLFKQKVNDDARLHQKYEQYGKTAKELIDKFFSARKEIESKEIKEASQEVFDVIGLTKPALQFIQSLLSENASSNAGSSTSELGIGALADKLAKIVESIPGVQENTQLNKQICHYLVCRIMDFLNKKHEKEEYQLQNVISKVTIREEDSDKRVELVKIKYLGNNESDWMSYFNMMINLHGYVMTIPECIAYHKNISDLSELSRKFVISLEIETDILTEIESKIEKIKSQDKPKTGLALVSWSTVSSAPREIIVQKIIYLLMILQASWGKKLTEGKFLVLQEEFKGAVKYTQSGSHRSKTRTIDLAISQEVSVRRDAEKADTRVINKHYETDLGSLSTLKSGLSSVQLEGIPAGFQVALDNEIQKRKEKVSEEKKMFSDLKK